MSTKHKVTIIEPSEIVSAGLKQLVEYGGNFHVTKIFKSIQDYSENLNGNPDIILINPTALNIGDSNDPRNIITAKDNVAIVAICYLAYNEETLRNYDGCIGMFSTQEQIEKKLISALKTTSDKEQDDNSITPDVEEKLLRFGRAAVAVMEMRGKSYLSIGSVSMGIAGSMPDPDFFQEYLGMRNEAVDCSEIARRSPAAARQARRDR